MGPDSNKMLKPDYKSLYKHASRLVYENKDRKTDLKSRDEGKRDDGHSQQIKLNNSTVSLWDKRKDVFVQSQLPWRLMDKTTDMRKGFGRISCKLVVFIFQLLCNFLFCFVCLFVCLFVFFFVFLSLEFTIFSGMFPPVSCRIIGIGKRIVNSQTVV